MTKEEARADLMLAQADISYRPKDDSIDMAIKALENGAIILRAEDKCTTAENNQFVEMIERDAFERNIPFKEAFCNRNRQLIVEELEEIKEEIDNCLIHNPTYDECKINKGLGISYKIIDNHIKELKGEQE